MVGVFTFGLIFVLNHMEKLGAAHTTITYPSFWSFHTQGDSNVQEWIRIFVPGSWQSLSWSPLLSSCKCSVQVFLCSLVPVWAWIAPETVADPLFVMTTQEKDELSPWIGALSCCLLCWKLLLYFGAVCSGSSPLHAGVTHELLALRGDGALDSSVHNILYKIEG